MQSKKRASAGKRNTSSTVKPSRSTAWSDDDEQGDLGEDCTPPLPEREEADGSDASDEQEDKQPPLNFDEMLSRWSPPKGRNIAAYEGWRGWNKYRWAWEFLRRNTGFQRRCNAAGRDETAIAQRYRLTRFKDYREEYDDGTPARLAVGIVSIPHRAQFVERSKARYGVITEKVDLFPTEVLIRFQLAPTRLARKAAIDAQIEQARKRLDSFAAKLALAQPNYAPGKHMNTWAFNRRDLLAALRVLDIEHAEFDTNHVEIANLLIEDPNGQDSDVVWTEKQRSDAGRKLRATSHKLRRSDYLLIATVGLDARS